MGARKAYNGEDMGRQSQPYHSEMFIISLMISAQLHKIRLYV